MNVGEKIAGLRKSHNFSQETLAEMIHVSRQTLSNWENGKSYPSLETILQISNIFDVSIDEWLKEDTSIVKKIDAEKTKKNRLFIVSAALFLVIVLSVGGAFWFLQSERIQSEQISFDMFQHKAYQVGADNQSELEAGTGFFALPKNTRVKLSVEADTDDGELMVKITENGSGSGKIYYQKGGQVIKDKQSIYLKKGDYKIQVIVTDYEITPLTLSYKIDVNSP